MSSISIGDYELQSAGDGKLVVEERSTGEQIEIDGSSFSGDSIETKAEHGTDDAFSVDTVYSALSSGYLVGLGHEGYIITVDPRDYASDATAMQQAYDELSVNGNGPGNLIIPSNRPDGSRWEIDKTVEFSHDDSNILPLGYGFAGGKDSIKCTIDDGSPMFKIGEPDVGGAADTIPFGNFAADGQQKDNEALHFYSSVHWHLSDVNIRNFNIGSNSTSDGVIVIDYQCFTWSIDNFVYVNGTDTADVVVLQNSVDSQQTNMPGNAVIKSGFEVNGDCRTALRSKTNNPAVRFNGYIEEAGNASEGTAAIYFPDGSGSLTVGSEALFGSNNNEQIYFNGAEFMCLAGQLGNVSGGNENIIHVGDNAAQFSIQPFTRLGSVGGDDIAIDGPPANPSTVPFESQLTGTMSGAFASDIMRPNGMHGIKEGTVSISAGGTATVEYAGSSAWANDVHFALDSDPGGDVQIRTEWFYDSSNGQQVKFIETGGSTGGTIKYAIYRREM